MGIDMRDLVIGLAVSMMVNTTVVVATGFLIDVIDVIGLVGLL